MVCFLRLRTVWDIRQTEATLLYILVNYWRRKLVSSIKKGKLVTLCFSKCPTFRVGRPPIGTLDLQVIKAVKEKVFRPGFLRHPDQASYIVTWNTLVEDPPTTAPWIKAFLSPRPSSWVLNIRKKEAWEEGPVAEKSILQDPLRADLLLQGTPPPYPPTFAPMVPPHQHWSAHMLSGLLNLSFNRGRSRRRPTFPSSHGDPNSKSNLL